MTYFNISWNIFSWYAHLEKQFGKYSYKDNGNALGDLDTTMEFIWFHI